MSLESQLKILRSDVDVGERSFSSERLCLYYQPVVDIDVSAVVDIDVSAVVFYESLLRHFSSEGEVLTPCSLIQRAEQDGSIVAIDCYVLAHVFEVCQQDVGTHFSFNASSQSIENRVWQDCLRRLMLKNPEVCQRIVLEITETCDFVLSIRAGSFLKECTDRGLRVALDDVDQVSFDCLVSRFKKMPFPVSFLKISRSLTKQMFSGASYQNDLLTLLTFARDEGLVPVIEGVETKEQYDALINQKGVLLQGYYLGRPAASCMAPFSV